ncbi:MAG: C1 family peptidase [Melioribacteraceae bacterium]|nr:C1 family peptidase [Melioribacteraceae bacterium]MCF8355676.1 C1 family peptidase [Melioribacteraceae bacterium]MCF8396341.1 C1 family peptidase [Melioribacteraceae bacterium]MCF8420326.1 C1 family peptidase [Melioribacteraceae bacterium]
MLLINLVLVSAIFAQTPVKDKGNFVESKAGYWEEIQKGIDEFNSTEKESRKSFTVDLSGYDLPKSIDEFTSYWYNDPVSQGNTGTCWSFSTTSFFESEVYRIHGMEVKLSEIWAPYWEYVEKAKSFVETRGKSLFAQGSEANAVTKIWKKYGIVPLADFTGMLPEQKFHDHSKMFNEMRSYLQSVKAANAWNEEIVISTIKSILNKYLGTPPAKITVDGKDYSPREYLTKYLKLNLDDYIDILSYMQQPYYQQVEYEVPDNWWHNKDYYNVPLDEFMSTLKSAVKNGYTVSIGGDVSEAGKDSWEEVAIVPTFDIPSEYIDENARQFRFSNGTTTDDHGIHVVGFKEDNGKDWYLIKDSGSGARNGNNKGFYFFHEDYVKLKMMDFMVHKDAVGDLLNKFNPKN